MTEEELESWKKTQNRHCMCFDGASKNNPKKLGASGIIYDPNGEKITTYKWGLGQMSNNQVKAYSLLMGTKMIKKKRNPKSYHHRRLSHHNRDYGSKQEPQQQVYEPNHPKN